mgnify:CR=1 FL=1
MLFRSSTAYITKAIGIDTSTVNNNINFKSSSQNIKTLINLSVADSNVVTKLISTIDKLAMMDSKTVIKSALIPRNEYTQIQVTSESKTICSLKAGKLIFLKNGYCQIEVNISDTNGLTYSMTQKIRGKK